MKRLVALAGMIVLAVSALCWINRGLPAAAQEIAQAPPLHHPAALINIYCAGCHTSGRSRIDLDGLVDVQSVRRERATWKKVARALRSEYMPPEGQPRPSSAEREFLIGWIEDATREGDASTPPEPLLARRLQQTEYVNTIRDLVGISFQPGEDFPADEVAWNACQNVPLLDTALREKYGAAATRILDEAVVSASHQRIFIPWPTGASRDEYARAVLTAFARRAYRRPLNAGEARALYAVFEAARGRDWPFEKAIQAGLEEVLTSPSFLYRLRARTEAVSAYSLRKQFDLASRLSYFLWSSMPDDELLAEARSGTLHLNLHRQARRMLADPRSQALAEGFAASWLDLGSLTSSSTLGDVALMQALRKETELFVARIMQEDRSVLEFLDADYTFVNERLALHYGIPGVQGDTWQCVPLEGGQRGGVLTQGSVLTLTSRNNQTLPVMRGKWVLEHLLGTPTPAPPSDALAALALARRDLGTGTARQRLEHHRANPGCAQCHEKMDALGFALENFDAVGSWRTHDFGQPIDPAVTLPDGKLLSGPADLRTYLLGHQDLFVRCLSEKLLSYALGRKLEAHERAALDGIPQDVAGKPSFFSILQAILSSPAFLDGVKPNPSFDLASKDSPANEF